MTDEKQTTEELVDEEVLVEEDTTSSGEQPAEVKTTPRDFRGRGKGSFKKNVRKPVRREVKVKPEFDQKIISIRRVTRVVSGGRRFSFSVAVVAGNKKGMVGIGLGKSSDTPLAIDKAFRDAKKNMVKIDLKKDMTLSAPTEAKYAGSVVKIMPSPGKGVVAGSSVRDVLEFAGIKEVSAKLLSRSKNKINNARAAVKALSKLHIRKRVRK